VSTNPLPMEQPRASRWLQNPCTLSFRFAEVTLRRWKLRGLVLDSYYADLPADPMQPAPPFDRLGVDADVIVTRSHPVAEPLAPVQRQNGVLRYVTNEFRRFRADLSGTFDGYLGRFSSKSRSTLKRKVRKFVEQTPAGHMRAYKTSQEMKEFFALARPLSALTYQERLLDSGLPAGDEFLAKLFALADADEVRAYLLFSGETPVAYLCCPASNGVLSYDYVGFDPKFSDASPGTVLQYLAFESLFAEGRFRTFDFTEGEGGHKELFATHATQCADVWYFRDTFANRFGVGMHRGLDRLSARAGHALESIGIKKLVKRLIRRL
jgi:CelD/BcsL family acetyltransferase involved in cellulose biosynthesis